MSAESNSNLFNMQDVLSQMNKANTKCTSKLPNFFFFFIERE